MKTESIEFIRRRFANVVCPAMGWTYADTFKLEGGYVFIEKCMNGRYRVCQRVENSTGERNLSDALTKAELLAWCDGMLKACDVFERRAKS